MLLLSFVSFKYKFLKLCFIYELTLYFCNSNSTKENTVDRKRGSTLKVWMYCTYCSHSGLLINKSWDGSLASCSVLDSCEVHYQEKRQIRPQVTHDFSQMELRFPSYFPSKLLPRLNYGQNAVTEASMIFFSVSLFQIAHLIQWVELLMFVLSSWWVMPIYAAVCLFIFIN